MSNRIQPAPDTEQWQATIAAFREYLKDCRTWLTLYRKHRESATIDAPAKTRKPSASAKSTHVYLLAAGHARQPATRRDRSGCMPLWVVLGDETRHKTVA